MESKINNKILNELIKKCKINNAYIDDTAQAQKELVDIIFQNKKLKHNFLILGKNGSGKSNFCALTAPFGKTLYINTESGEGCKHAKILESKGLMEVCDWQNLDISTNFDLMRKQVVDICEKKEYRVVIIDSVNTLEKLLCNYLTKMHALKADSTSYDWDLGRVLKRYYYQTFRNFMNRLSNLGVSVVMTCYINSTGTADIKEWAMELINSVVDSTYTIINTKDTEQRTEKITFVNKDRSGIDDGVLLDFFKDRMLKTDAGAIRKFDNVYWEENKIIPYGLTMRLASIYAQNQQ